MYQIVDFQLDTKVGIPSGSKYDVPLMFSSHYFTASGDLTDESKETTSIYGDTWLVNGQIQPFLKVEPRKYRLRIVNGAVSRTLNFTIEAAGDVVPMAVIAADSGLREGPATTRSLITGMAERWEIIVDFAPYAGKNLLMRATNMWTDPEFKDSDKLMQFRVAGAGSTTRASRVVKQGVALPQKFPGVDINFPTDKISATRDFKMVSHMDMMWGINSYHLDDPMKRVLMRPPLGTIEKYVFRSSGMGMNMGSGGMGGMGNMGSNTGAGEPESAPQPKDNGQSSHHGGGDMMGGHMGGMMGNMKRALERKMTFKSSAKFDKRQMSGMPGGHNMGGMTGSNYWTHAMHLHLVVSNLPDRTEDLMLSISGHEDCFTPQGRSKQTTRA